MATTTQTSTTQLPDFLQARLNDILARGNTISQQPYQPYGGPRIAGFTAPQQQSFNLAQNSVGSYQPFLNSSSSLYSTTGQLFNPTDFQQFMNPYTSNVVDQIANLGSRNLTENILPKINDTFTGAGQFGSRRNADFTNQAIRDTQEAVTGAQGQALYNSNNAAMQGYEQALGRLGNTATGLQGLANTQSALQGTDLQRLNTVGQQQQDLTQQNYNLDYQDFLNQMNQPKENLNWLSGLASGQPYSTSTMASTNTGSPSSSNSLLTLLGLGGLNYLSGSGGGSGGLLNGLFAKGGKAKASDKMGAYRDKMKSFLNGPGSMRLGAV
jgi:hypothetical protein